MTGRSVTNEPGPAEDGSPGAEPTPLVIQGTATDEEVAAVVTVLQGVAAAAAAAATSEAARRPPTPWSSPARRVRRPHAAGAGAWRASALPH